MADLRLLVGPLGERLRLALQPLEIEGLGGPEAELAGIGGSPGEAAIEQGQERGCACGEQRLAARQLHGFQGSALG